MELYRDYDVELFHDNIWCILWNVMFWICSKHYGYFRWIKIIFFAWENPLNPIIAHVLHVSHEMVIARSGRSVSHRHKSSKMASTFLKEFSTKWYIKLCIYIKFNRQFRVVEKSEFTHDFAERSLVLKRLNKKC